MKYKILFLIFVLSQIALAHEITNTVGNTKISLELLPNEIPKAGKISIIAFEVTDINNRPLSHIDGYLTIRKGNTIIISDYLLHSHGNKFSMARKLDEAGSYDLIIKVKPSEHYENIKFNPVETTFNVNVIAGNEGETYAIYGIIVAVLILIAALYLIFTRRKK